MRVDTLISTGNDGVVGNATGHKDGRANNGLQFLAGKLGVPVNKSAVFVDAAAPQGLDGLGHTHLSHGHCSLHLADFIRRLEFALGKDGADVCL